MNETIKGLTAHRSVRKFKTDALPAPDIQSIMEASQQAPNWANGQQVSVIAVEDKTKKQKLAELVGNQAYVAEAGVFFVFCMDFSRAAYAAEKTEKHFGVVDDVEALLIGAADVGIALGTAVAAAESLSYGTVPIGGIRRNTAGVVDLLELPEFVFPISGLAVGHPETPLPNQNPRLDISAFYHKEAYQSNQKQVVDDLDTKMEKLTEERTGNKRTNPWSTRIGDYYETKYKDYSTVKEVLKKQGFHYN